jgi:hypothetical protein
MAEEEVCLELTDLLLQGLLLELGWGMAEEEEEEAGGMGAEVEALLAEVQTAAGDDGACSVITRVCEVMPSEGSARKRKRGGRDEEKEEVRRG